jgi:hypothetical protein
LPGVSLRLGKVERIKVVAKLTTVEQWLCGVGNSSARATLSHAMQRQSPVRLSVVKAKLCNAMAKSSGVKLRKGKVKLSRAMAW